MSDPKTSKKPVRPVTSLSGGLVLVLWGAFFYLYPQAVNLPPAFHSLLTVLTFACFALGVLVAGGGVSNLTQSQFLKNSATAIALAIVAYIFYLISLQLAEDSPWSTIWKMAVVPIAALAIMIFGMAIPDLLEERSRVPPMPTAELEAGGISTPETARGLRLERIAELLIAILGIAAAGLALLREFRGDQ